MPDVPRIIDLVEYERVNVPAGKLAREDAEWLWKRHSPHVSVEAPSFKNNDCWELQASGWVGFIPVADRLVLRLSPKVPLRSLFGMMEYAYQLRLEIFEGLQDVDALREMYERLAHLLARRVLDRCRRGLYREYVSRHEALPFVRGSVDWRAHARRPWATRLDCRYEDHTSDVTDNQILTWTLLSIARSGLCSERVRPTVRRAFHLLDAATTRVPVRASACVDRTYNRLSEDYGELHALCRFFLESSGASHERGGHEMLPFLINMNQLFESCVVEWLKAHLPENLSIRFQHRVRIEAELESTFKVDALIVDAAHGRPLLVLDAKYKRTERAATDDVAQVIAYAEATGAPAAMLVYPTPVGSPLSTNVGRIHLVTGCFDVSGSLEEGGQRLLEQVKQLVAGNPV